MPPNVELGLPDDRPSGGQVIELKGEGFGNALAGSVQQAEACRKLWDCRAARLHRNNSGGDCLELRPKRRGWIKGKAPLPLPHHETHLAAANLAVAVWKVCSTRRLIRQ